MGIRLDSNPIVQNATQFPSSGFGYRYLELRSSVEGDTTPSVRTMFASLSGLEAEIALITGGSDYAEFMKKQDPTEALLPGDVVGVFSDGSISRSTEGASHLLVISTSPSIVGNMPANLPIEVVGKMAIVAMLGQVPTKVRGRVELGSVLVPSGLNDGFAVAITTEELLAAPSRYSKVIGISWGGHLEDGDGLVTAAVGLSLQHLTTNLLEEQAKKIAQLESRLVRIEKLLELNSFSN